MTTQSSLKAPLAQAPQTTEIDTKTGLLVTLRATRAWVRAMQPGTADEKRVHYLQQWHAAFAELNCVPAARQWDAVMQFLATKATHPFYIGCAGCGAVNKHELRMMAVLACHQLEFRSAAMGHLSFWFEGIALEKMFDLTALYADYLLLNGYRFPENSKDIPRHDLASADTFFTKGECH